MNKFNMMSLNAACLLLLGSLSVAAQSERDDGEYSAVRVRDAELIGTVFIASEEESSTELPGQNVLIQIEDSESEEIIRETRTDDLGQFKLARLPATGAYFMYVGGLKLNLDVIAAEEAGPELPKVIIVLIPEEMANTERGQ